MIRLGAAIRRGTVGAALTTAALVPACGSGGSAALVIGSKNFTEQDLLGELVAQWVERTTRIPVRRRLHLGGTFICHRALTAGEIDLYVEYTGTAFTAILEHDPLSDPDSVFRTVSREYRDRFGVTWTDPLGFENTFAILVRGSTADSLGIATLSEAVPHAEGWTGGFGYEFMERADGFAGLSAAYDLRLRQPARVMELGLIYRALSSGDVDLTAGSSTDGLIEALGLVVLEDDRGYFPPYFAAPVVRDAALARHPELGPALEDLAGRISPAEIRAMNRAVDVEGEEIPDVASRWVAGELDPSRARS